jgi:CelD/BcsL family acetyltransferase involved in cellulose biosynthesis
MRCRTSCASSFRRSRSAWTRPPEAGAAALVETFDDLEGAPTDWDGLAERAGNVFATPEWARVWWRHFGRGSPVVALARGDDGRAASLVALELRGRRPLRVARFVGHGPGDQLGPVGPRDHTSGAEALAALKPRFDLLLAERLPGTGWSDRLGGRMLQREASPVIAVPEGGWDAYLASRSSNLRSQLRRKERKLLGEHGLRFRLSSDPDRVPEDMETLVRLHFARWGEERSAALRTQAAKFHFDFAVVALERGWLRLWLAEIEGRPVAAWYGFRYGGSESYYQSGRDPEWHRHSVGLVLLAHTIREAMNDGVSEYRLLRGGEAYKDRLATGDPGLESVAVAGGAVSGAALAGAPLVLRVRRALRRRRSSPGS